MFAVEEHVENFRKAFGGERMHPSEKGKGTRWSQWKKGSYKPKAKRPYDFSWRLPSATAPTLQRDKRYVFSNRIPAHTKRALRTLSIRENVMKPRRSRARHEKTFKERLIEQSQLWSAEAERIPASC
jgi:hypothetical protein